MTSTQGMTTPSADDDWEESVKLAIQEDQEGSDDDGSELVYEAKTAALAACDTLIQTLKHCLEALEGGDLDEAAGLVAEENTEKLLQTVRYRVQEVCCKRCGTF